MSNKKAKDLVEAVHRCISISCDKCDREDENHEAPDEDDAAEDFFEMGWRLVAKSSTVYCPDCVKNTK